MSYIDSYYFATVNKQLNCPKLVGETSADVCIIGAGYTGLSAALHLAEKGYSVALLEAQKVGWGASGRNGGQVAQDYNMPHQELVKKVGRQIADSLWDMSIESVDLVKELISKHQIECDLKAGVLHVAAKASHCSHIKASVDYKQSVLGYDKIQYIDEAQVADMLGINCYHNGELWQDAAHLHPLNYALGLAKAAQDAGVHIYEESPVIEYQGGDRGFVKTDSGTVKAKYILLACNGYLGKLEPKIAGKVMPINNFIIATEPLPDEMCRKINRDDVAVADSKFVINYFKLSGDNRLLWGGGENYSTRFPRDIPNFVRKYMLAYYPELADVKIDYGWGGTLAITLNRMPYFNRIENNVYAAQGYSGHGVALATLGGKIMAQAISGDAEKFDMFANVPTPTFPGGTLLRFPGLVAGMLYYAMRDRFF
ncbi:FAD-binding oxidoreductase [Oceaniserpentilla sp. 4NH20-0058]|uniref:NAD(P)/FAD-dependent oxidoreductase n=1 Tax=Oceaniserpentilla sp. 4NH20-0058 TaxID=3127660 RepID=UPI00310964B0